MNFNFSLKWFLIDSILIMTANEALELASHSLLFNMKKIIILFLITAFGFAQNVKLKTGDFLFQSMDCGPLCEAINEVTQGYQGKDFSHLGIVYIQNDSI